MFWGNVIISVRLLSYNANYAYDGRQPEGEVNIFGVLLSIFSPFILFGAYFLYLRYKQKHKIIEWLGKRSVPYSEFSFREVQVVLALIMMKRDRYLIAVKQARIRQFIKKEFPKGKIDVDEIADIYLNQKIPMAPLMEWCDQFLSAGQKLETFCFLYGIACINNEISQDEKAYLLYLLQKMEIRNQDLNSEIQDALFGNGARKKSTVLAINKHYVILELTETASGKEVKEAYRRLVKKYHPDSHPGLTAEEKKQLAEKFQQVQEAYNVLTSVQ